MTEHEQKLRKGLLPALLAIVLVALVYAGMIVRSDFERRQTEVERSLDSYAEVALTSVDKLFSGYATALGAIAESRCIRAADQPVCREFFPGLLNRFPEAVNFAATDAEGNVFASSRLFNPQKPPNAKKLPFFKALAAGQPLYIMDPHIGPVSGEPIVGVALPLLGNDGKFAGVIGVTLKFEQIRQRWESRAGGVAHSLAIFDRNDQLIFSSGLPQAWGAQAATILGPVLHKGEAGSIVAEGVQLFTHTDFLPGADWKIITMAPVALDLKAYFSGNLLVVALALPILLLAFLGALIYLRERRATALLLASDGLLRSAYAELEVKVVERTAELAASEQHWRLLLDSTTEAIYGVDLAGRCTFCNPAALRMLGEKDAAALLGVEMHGRIHYRKSDGSAYPLEDCPIISVLGSGDQAFVDDEVFFRSDGSSFPVRYGAHPIRRDGAIIGAVVTFFDLSESRRKEDEYRSVIQASIDGFWINDFAGQILDVNESLCRMLGYSRDELLAMHISDLEAIEKPEEAAAHILKLIMSGSEQFLTLHRRKDGSLIDVEISVLYVAELGQRFFVFVRDISERIRLEEQLQNQHINLEVLVQQRTADLEAALDAAKLADLAKDAFLANVSHELRTPLNAVIGMSSLARRLSHDPAQQAYLDKVGNAGQTLAHLINDLLDLSKIVAGRMEFESTTFSLRQMIERSSSVMSYRAADKNLQLLDRIDQDVPDILVGDPLRIEQILLNLLSNAIKFTAAGRIEVRIGVLERAAERVCLAIEVEDSGVGLSEDEIALLFKPFAQADASMTRKYGGTGLGLAICKRLAEMMEGGIGVSSRQGQGSTFRVVLWLGLGKVEELPEGKASNEAPLPQGYRDTRILVVEDQPLNREIVEALLSLVGITPRMAGDGQQALDILDASGPDAFDLVLMDVQMPVMDGLTATRELRRRAGFESLPVIAMTAHTMEHEREISAGAGMNDHIGKPFDNDSFYRTLARWIPLAKQLAHGELPAAQSAGNPAAPAVAIPHLDDIDGIDTKAGIARFTGNEERYRHWLLAFVEEGPATLAQIRAALAGGSTEAARQAAHAFKGRVGMLGMDALHGVASELEAALKQGAPVEGWLHRLEQLVGKTSGQIAAVLGSRKTAATPAIPQTGAPASGPAPEGITQLLGLLNASDGGSAAAIARVLEAYQGSAWAPRLQQALSHAQNFDFAAAAKLLSPAAGRDYEI